MTRPANVRVAVVAVVVALAWAATSCGTASSEVAKLADARTGVARFAQSDARPALERRIQERVASCMHDRGFDYTPYVPADRSGYADDATDYHLDTDTSPALVRSYLDQLAVPGGAPTAGPSSSTDPNEAIRAALTGDRRDEYDRALDGVGTAKPGVTDVRVAGCLNGSTAQVLGPTVMRALWQIEDLDTEVTARVGRDPAVRTVDRAVAACVAGRGYVVDPGSGQDPVEAALLAEVASRLGVPAASSIGELADRVDVTRLVALAPEMERFETRLRQTFVGCARRHRLESVMRSAQARANRAVVDEHGSDIDAVSGAVSHFLATGAGHG